MAMQISKITANISKDTIKEYGIMIMLYLIMFVNQWYMHYEVFFQNTDYYKAGVQPMYSWWQDVLFTFLFFYLCTLGRRKLSYIFTYILLSIFVLANIGYSRFFGQYITPSVLNEASNFKGTWWVSYIPEMFRWTDLLLVATTIAFGWGIKKLRKRRTHKDLYVIISLIVLPFVPCTLIIARHWQTKDEAAMWFKNIDFREKIRNDIVITRDYTIAYNGILRGQVYCNLIRNEHHIELSTTDLKEIKSYIDNSYKSATALSDSCMVKGKPNIIFIIVESYMSVASRTKVGGKEITPYLNSLMRDKGNYANTTVTSNRECGESSDAQVSYFTGLIPLKSEMSVLHIIKNELIALPKLLRDQKGYDTYLTLPTDTCFWHQNDANIKYGIDNVIVAGNANNKYWCQDEELFNIVKHKSNSLKEPYMNIILTLSMHGPYSNDFLSTTKYKSPFNYPSDYSNEFRYYLDRCYYTDMQIGRYINYLKKTKIYDNSVIVICSDHETQEGSLNRKGCTDDLPLIIANTGINSKRFYKGRINQIDVFPTMLDMFGIKSEWRGMGHSLLRSNYDNTITDKQRNISNKILLGNYFAQ